MARIGKEKKEAIRKSILETAHRLFFEVGYEKTSTSKIAKEVGIAEGTIFNYFKTKSDILMEVLTTNYYDIGNQTLKFDVSDGIVEYYVNYCKKAVGKFFKLPKKVLTELFIAMMVAAKKNKNMIQKFAQLDFKFLEELEGITIEFQRQGLLKDCDAKLLSESLFAAFMYEIILFFYETDDLLEDMYQRIEDKFRFELKHYVTKKE